MHDSVERTDSETSPSRRLQVHSPADASARVASARPVRHHSARTRVAMLEATVAALHFERDCLQRRVDDLEGQCRALRADVETLETKLDAKEQQREQIIQTYERVLSAREDCEHVRTTDQRTRERTSGTDDSDGHDGEPTQSTSDQSTLLSSSLLDALFGSQ